MDWVPHYAGPDQSTKRSTSTVQAISQVCIIRTTATYNSKSSHKMNVPTDFNYQPFELSDVTVHFGKRAFHVHSLILKKESNVLAVAVDGADGKECELTDACKKSGHRCFTLCSPLGITDVDDSQMKSFFDHMYNPAKMFQKPAFVAPVGADRKPILLGATVYSAKYLSPEEWSDGMFTGRSGSRSELEITKERKIYYVPPNKIFQTASSTSIKSSQPTSLKQFLKDSDVVIRLCHFFDCSVFLRSFQSYIFALLIDTAVFRQPTEMFALLLLCDYCHFDRVIPLITRWLLDNKDCLDIASERNKIIKSFRNETSAVLMEIAFGRP